MANLRPPPPKAWNALRGFHASLVIALGPVIDRRAPTDTVTRRDRFVGKAVVCRSDDA